MLGNVKSQVEAWSSSDCGASFNSEQNHHTSRKMQMYFSFLCILFLGVQGGFTMHLKYWVTLLISKRIDDHIDMPPYYR